MTFLRKPTIHDAPMRPQDKGEVELEDFTDWWIMLQTQVFCDENQRLVLPLEAAKAVMIHHPAVSLKQQRAIEIFESLDSDEDFLITFDDLLRAVSNRRRNGDVLTNKLTVELGLAEEVGHALDMEEFKANWQILDTLDQGRVDIDQWRGYYEEVTTPSMTRM